MWWVVVCYIFLGISMVVVVRWLVVVVVEFLIRIVFSWELFVWVGCCVCWFVVYVCLSILRYGGGYIYIF